ncbi:UNVERIFIED_CONTAM: hypothetical protein RMT77_011278 [Armadillidium vulgare]
MYLESTRNVGIFVLLIFIWGSAHAIEFIDLGHELGPETPVFPFPGYIPFEFITQVGNTEQGIWVAYNNIKLSEHLGTHIDAPYHTNPNGWKLHEIPLERFFAPAAVIDLRSKVEKDPLYLMTAHDVNEWVSNHGLFPNNSVIIINTGWSSRWPDPVKYFGHPTDPLKSKFPSVGEGAVRAILNYKKSHNIEIVGLGIDTATPDLLPAVKAHELTTKENIYLLENLNENLAKLPPQGARLMVMPIKIRGGTGAPTRVIARLPYN